MKLNPKYRINLFSLIAIITVLLLNSCGGGSSGGGVASSGGNGKSGIAGISGRIVMSDGLAEPSIVDIHSLDIKNGKVQRSNIITRGHGSNIGIDGDIIYVQTCISYKQRIVIIDRNGKVTPISSCSNFIDNPPDATLSHYDYISPKFSPDQKKIAVSLITTNEFVKTVYPMVAVFDRDEKTAIDTDLTKLPSVKIFRGYNDFAWRPDGSLLLIGSGKRLILKEGSYGEVLEELPTIKYGIYVTDKDLNNPVRIESIINSPIYGPDVNKKGTLVTYSSNNNIFIMDLATGLPQKIRANTIGGFSYTPVWSPDGKYIAYAQRIDYRNEDTLYFYELSSKSIISIDVPNRKEVEAPLSWIAIQ